jgi:hypothetical protein
MKIHDIHLQALLSYITPTKILCILLQLFFLIKVLIGDRQETKFLAPGSLEYSPRQTGRTPIKIASDMWIPHCTRLQSARAGHFLADIGVARERYACQEHEL